MPADDAAQHPDRAVAQRAGARRGHLVEEERNRQHARQEEELRPREERERESEQGQHVVARATAP